MAAEVSSLTMYPGATDELSVVCYPQNATNKEEYTNITNQYWNYDYKYITGVSGSLRIDEDCPTNITNKPVTVSVKGLQATVYITVRPRIEVTSVSLNKTTVNMKVGEQVSLQATILPEDADNKALNWSSSNTNVATVDQSGQVTAITPGAVTITATSVSDTDKQASCQVTVTNNANAGNEGIQGGVND